MTLSMRQVVSAEGPEAVRFFLASTAADIPSAASANVGDVLNVKGPLVSDRKVYIAAAGPSGMVWVDCSGGIPAGDLTVTGSLLVEGGFAAGVSTLEYANVKSDRIRLKSGGAEFGQLVVPTMAAARTWTFPDRDGIVMTSAGGTVVAPALETHLDFASPSGDGTLFVENSVSSNKGLVRATGGVGMFGAVAMPSQHAAVADLPAFTDPPTTGEMEGLRQAVNALLAMARAGTGTGALAA